MARMAPGPSGIGGIVDVFAGQRHVQGLVDTLDILGPAIRRGTHRRGGFTRTHLNLCPVQRDPFGAPGFGLPAHFQGI